MIRMAGVAKHLGIASQELRKLLTEVNLGVKPTDREIPENLAAGIVRFAARRFKIKCPPLIQLEEETGEESEDQKISSEEKELSSLTQLKTIAQNSKKDLEKRKKMVRESAGDEAGSADGKGGGKKLSILRKIEISPEAAAKAKEKMKEEEEMKRQLKQEKDEEIMERKLLQKKKQEQIFKKKEGSVEIPDHLPIKEFAEKIGIPTSQILAALVRNGVMATLNSTIDFDTCSLISLEFDIEVKKAQADVSSESLFSGDISELLKDEKENLKTRPPVIVVIGHVDHGKTSILDRIRKAKVAEGEAGGITQHIGAYQIEKNGRLITFLDTPGHESFTAMRARGTKTADIAILVIAADEGIKPQTVEAINHAKEADIPIIVAMNKMDKESANPEKVKGELNEHGLQVEEWGGKTPLVPVSAHSGAGIEELLEIVLLQADLLELAANSKRRAVGTVIEAHLDPSIGPVGTILVNTGTLHIKDIFIIGKIRGRVKTMVNDTGKNIISAPPSSAVQISGIDSVPIPGDILQVFENEKILKNKLEELETLHERKTGRGMGVSEIIDHLKQGNMKFLKVVLKADTNGSLEAVKQAVGKIKHEEVGVKIIHAAVGAITETDVMMAAASQGLVVGFNVIVSPRVRRISEKESVEIMNYDIIYKLTEDIEKILGGLLEPELVETVLGRAFVKQIFYTKKKMMILGCKIESGKIKVKSKIRVYRKEEKIGEGVIAALQHFEKKVPEIEEGQECGIQFEGNFPLEERDVLEAYEMEKRIRTL